MSDPTGSAPRAAVFLRVATDPIIAVWLGFGAIAVPANALDVAGQTYGGLGQLVGVPELQKLLNGVSDRAVFTLSGVPVAMLELADSEAADIEGAAVNVGICQMDGDWQLDGPVLWLWAGRADVLITEERTDAEGNQFCAVSLSVGTGSPGRARADFATWTDAQHQAAHPGDLILNHLPPPEKTKKWPGDG